MATKVLKQILMVVFIHVKLLFYFLCVIVICLWY